TASLEVFDLKQLLIDVVPAYQDLYPDAYIELQPINDTIFINGSQELIVQMLDKLISNAIDFHQTDTPIELSLKVEEKSCMLMVRNIGIMLPDNMTEQLFQPMVSLRQSATPSSLPHLGLGLHIVKLVAEIHKGRVEGRNWQEGVEFCIELPIIRS
ncbi:MAG: proteobacterial dedicated sortase system histidine kinase, partial [Methylophaga sp.]|nr:proteobacterial dedicated sortase system histidine kinase [Methylophaga sp.]